MDKDLGPILTNYVFKIDDSSTVCKFRDFKIKL